MTSRRGLWSKRQRAAMALNAAWVVLVFSVRPETKDERTSRRQEIFSGSSSSHSDCWSGGVIDLARFASFSSDPWSTAI